MMENVYHIFVNHIAEKDALVLKRQKQEEKVINQPNFCK